MTPHLCCGLQGQDTSRIDIYAFIFDMKFLRCPTLAPEKRRKDGARRRGGRTEEKQARGLEKQLLRLALLRVVGGGPSDADVSESGVRHLIWFV